MKLETNFLPQKPCFLGNFSQKTRLFEQPEGHMNNEEMLKVFRKTRTRGNFPGDENRNKLSQRVEANEKKALQLKSTLARPRIYDGRYPEELWTASPGNSLGVMRPSLILMFLQSDRKILEESTSFKGIQFVTIFGKKSIRKAQSESKLTSKPNVVHIAESVFQIK